MSGFSDFNLTAGLQNALNDLGFSTPTPIQKEAFSVICSGRDVMGIAQTGTGKTLAYLIPVLKMYQFTRSLNPKILILVPTRELVVQVLGEVEKLTKYMSIKSLGIFGGVNINTQKTAIYEGVDIVVGTPGRVMDLALDGVLRLDEVNKLIIDEFDELLNLGFKPQLTSIFSMMKRKRQNILFSATMTDDVDDMLEDYFDYPEEVSLAPSGTPIELITQLVYDLPNFNTKLNLLKYLLQKEEFERYLIFVNNKRMADLVYDKLAEDFEAEIEIIHSNKTQNYRLNAIRAFQESEVKGLITTDVMARGLDISNISQVINFEFPEQPETYIHRIGRTGRAGMGGTAISFCGPKDQNARLDVEILMNREIEVCEIPEDVQISKVLNAWEKEQKFKKEISRAAKKPKGEAFQEKAAKNKKVNLGGPSKTKKKTHGSVNRNLLKTQAQKKKKKS
ncbi:DEAD/DEAH box helicase [Flavobacterium aurantiibacter]|uniref:DEAD/DEAH box helicase n=1 Tax=Flavobacterium aurantiibacter TaxID=2023067 RepID=A0A255ZGH7_9FLAO|nr:DEAD/DEAH box helicase [Flavobacterium aurantiibacter]OYQ40653.1 DEAD/DEAH box helicase [Flavobacterium aurantiibacter]